MSNGAHKILLVGIGPTGAAIGRALAERGDCSIVGALDIDPARAGADLGVVLSGKESGTRVEADLAGLERCDAEIAVVATTSRLRGLAPLAAQLLERGLHVVSTAEELGFPHRSHPDIAAELDRLARANDAVILGTGCNPGFLMDTLPLALTSLVRRVESIEVRRTAEMSGYGAVLEKFGLGLTIDEFNIAQSDGAVIGHVGFEQSIAAIAAGLGRQLDEIEVDPVRPAFVAPELRRTPLRDVRRSTVTAVLHRARGMSDGRTLVDLQVHFGVFEDGDPVESGDHWTIHGDDTPLELHAPRGLDSLSSTVAVTANATTAAPDLRPGLRSMLDLPVKALACKGTSQWIDPSEADRGQTKPPG